jgi:hypothetical protein
MTAILVLCVLGAITEVYLPLGEGRGEGLSASCVAPSLTPPRGGKEIRSAFTQLELT